MSLIPTIISLASGALGGNAAASFSKQNSLGLLGNSLAGILGGGIGGQIIGLLLPSVQAAASTGNLDITSILASVASGGVGGGVLMAVIGMIRRAMNKG